MKTFDFQQVRGELDNGEYFGNIVNTPWHEDAKYDKFSDAEFQRRWDLTRQAMAKHGLDCIVVPGCTSGMSLGHGLVWLTGHVDERAMAHYVVFPREGEPTIICSMGGSHIESVRRAVSVKDVRPAPGAQFGRVIAERVNELGLQNGKIGLMNTLSETFGAEYLPANHYLKLRELLPAAQLEFVPEFFHELMVIKSKEEMKFARKAGALCDRALEAIAARAKPGVTEAQLAASAAFAMMDGGGYPHLIILAVTSMTKPRAIFGNVRPSNRVIREGDIIVNELGAAYRGTSAQAGNPVCVGEPPKSVQEFFYKGIVPGYKRMAEKLLPGNNLDDVRKAGTYFREHGYQSRPLHLHGIDVVSSGPHVGAKDVRHSEYDYVFKPGMELMLEPCVITADGLLGIFLGRTYFITEKGKEAITKYPIELTVVKPGRNSARAKSKKKH